MKANVWKAFIPITPRRVRIAQEDVDFFAARGIARTQLCGALAVLHVIRCELAPTVEALRTTVAGLRDPRTGTEVGWECDEPVSGSFLIHDRASGVPTTRRDQGAYVDVTLRFAIPVDATKILPARWRFIRPAAVTTEIAGIDRTALRGDDVSHIDLIIRQQSALVLDIIQAHRLEASDITILKHIGQCTHFLANMIQMVIA